MPEQLQKLDQEVPEELKKIPDSGREKETGTSSANPETPKPLELSPQEDKHLKDILANYQSAKEQGDPKGAIDYLNQYHTEFVKIQKEKQPKVETNIEQETIKTFQDLYDWLGLDINLEEEIKEKGIDALSSEEIKEVGKQGYTQTLIIPNLPRQTTLDAIKTKFAEEFGSEGIRYWTEDYKNTIPFQEETSKKPYQIVLKPNLETNQLEEKDSKYDTIDKTFPECQNKLKDLNDDNPDLNFKGLNLPEYLIFQAYTYYQAKQKDADSTIHPDAKTWTWLLGETLPDGSRCLRAFWTSGDREVDVSSGDASNRHSDGGARFAAIPAKLIR